MEKFLNKLKELNSRKEINYFVNERLNFLEENTKTKSIDIFNPINKGYINSKSPIYAHILYAPFYIDDFNIYIEYINYLKSNNANSLIKILTHTHNFILNKLGISNIFYNRLSIYEKNSFSVSIKEFYKTNSAACIEKTTLLNNLLSFCNIEHYTIFGELNSPSNEGHVYSVIYDKENSNYILLDIENPIILKGNNQTFIAPSTNVIDKNKITDNDYEFDYKIIEKIYSAKLVENHPKNQKRIYTFPKEFIDILIPEENKENRKLKLENKED